MTFFKGDLSKMIVPIGGVLRDAMEAIDRGTRQIALVTDSKGVLVGVITDGDIRRGLMRGLNLQSPLAEITKPNFVSVKASEAATARSLLTTRNLHQIPLVDDAGRPVDIFHIDNLLDTPEHQTRVVLMAGGLGTRLRPLTETVPKPMLHIGGRPILEKIIEAFVSQGFRTFTISLNYKGEMIREYFGDGARFGAKIEYVEEKQRMGTAGALSLLPERPTAPFVVMNGDLLSSLQFDSLLKFHGDIGAMGTMCVREYTVQVPYGVVETDGALLRRIVEKPTHQHFINAGIYVLSPAALDFVEPDTYLDMPSLFERMIAADQTAATFPLDGYWIDIGRLEDLERARAEAPAENQP